VVLLAYYKGNSLFFYPLKVQDFSELLSRGESNMKISVQIRDRYVGLLTILIAIFLYYWSYEGILDISTSMEGVRSPRFFPRFTLVLMAFLSLILILQEKRRGKVSGKPIIILSLQMLTIAALSSGFVLFLDVLGFFICAPIVLVALMLYLGTRKWKKIIFISVFMPTILYLFFERFLDVMLPMGFLGHLLGK